MFNIHAVINCLLLLYTYYTLKWAICGDAGGMRYYVGIKNSFILDRSLIEVFANYRLCMSSRVYTSRTDSLGVEFFAREGSARIKMLDVWEMGPIIKAHR